MKNQAVRVEVAFGERILEGQGCDCKTSSVVLFIFLNSWRFFTGQLTDIVRSFLKINLSHTDYVFM